MLLGSVVSHKAFPAGPDGLFYCPTMDLLAIVTGGTSVSVFRLNWQKLLTLAVPPVAAFAWTPSGKAFTVLAASGQLHMWLTETGEMVSTAAAGERRLAHDAAAGALSWSKASLDASHLARFEAAGAAASETFPVAGGQTAKAMLLEPLLEVAVACRNDAIEVWWLWGGFLLLALEQPNVEHAWLTSDLSNLVFVTHAHESATVWVEPLPLLAKRAHELTALAVADQNLQLLLKSLTGAVEAMATSWRTAHTTLVGTLDVLQRRLKESGTTEPLPEVLLDMLLCGPRIDGTGLWLESDLGEKGSAKLLHTVAESAALLVQWCETLIKPLAEQLVARTQHLCNLQQRDEAFGALFKHGAQPYGDLLSHCQTLFKKVSQDLVPELQRHQRPMVAFCNWLMRRQKLSQYEEAVSGADEAGRKEIEVALNAQRGKVVLNEREVAGFMKDPTADGCAQLLDSLLFDASKGEALRVRARDAMSPLSVNNAVQVLSMPAEELNGAALHSDGPAATLALHRRDDVALVIWENVLLPQDHQLSVYDALEGEVVSAQFYKDGTLLVLSSDEDAKSSMLALVENGNEIKTRTFTGCGERLAVSKDRGLAAVQIGTQVYLVDVENDDEEEAAEMAGEG